MHRPLMPLMALLAGASASLRCGDADWRHPTEPWHVAGTYTLWRVGSRAVPYTRTFPDGSWVETRGGTLRLDGDGRCSERLVLLFSGAGGPFLEDHTSYCVYVVSGSRIELTWTGTGARETGEIGDDEVWLPRAPGAYLYRRW